MTNTPLPKKLAFGSPHFSPSTVKIMSLFICVSSFAKLIYPLMKVSGCLFHKPRKKNIGGQEQDNKTAQAEGTSSRGKTISLDRVESPGNVCRDIKFCHILSHHFYYCLLPLASVMSRTTT